LRSGLAGMQRQTIPPAGSRVDVPASAVLPAGAPVPAPARLGGSSGRSGMPGHLVAGRGPLERPSDEPGTRGSSPAPSAPRRQAGGRASGRRQRRLHSGACGRVFLRGLASGSARDPGRGPRSQRHRYNLGTTPAGRSRSVPASGEGRTSAAAPWLREPPFPGPGARCENREAASSAGRARFPHLRPPTGHALGTSRRTAPGSFGAKAPRACLGMSLAAAPGA